MNQQLIFLPLLAQVLLTAGVSIRLLFARISEIKRKRIHPQKIAITAGADEHFTDSRSISDNFSNLFEAPVMFYVLILALYTTELASISALIMTSAFVALRYVHSFIHCSYNNVTHRFYVYVTSTLLLWLSWALFALELISKNL